MIKINYEVIRENIKKISKNDYIVLKSNAYGFDFKEVLKLAIAEGIYKFCVISIDDAIYIRETYPFTKVLMLGVFDNCLRLAYEKYQIEVSINDLDEIENLKDYKINVQIKINSGMNRFGIKALDIIRCLTLIEEYNLRITGIYSHNATKNKEFIQEQLEAFYYASKQNLDLDVHFSASSLMNEEIKFVNCKRIGDAIFHNALIVFGKILKINYINKGEHIGYDYSYQLKKDSYVGVIDIGYADGLERNCNGFLVYIKNRYYYLIAKACMNYCFVLIDDSVKVGEIVHFISSYNNINNYINYFGKIPHEIYLSFLNKK